MVEYIYFVKCPDCEDEHFDFFDEAKCYAMRRLGQKPIITQTEVCRNDFGECTDHSDLGTIWSWEDLVGKDFVAEPVEQVFTKDDLKNLPVDNDPEFDDDDFYFMNNTIAEDYSHRVSFKSKAAHDEFMKLCSEIGIITGEDLDRFMVDHKADDSNLLDTLRAYRDELGTDFKLNPSERKPIPEGMTIEELVEEMEENEDTVECTWCNDLFDKSECRKEVDLGWLCSRCEAAIKSRGEPLTFRENDYWDFLDEAAEASGRATIGKRVQLVHNNSKYHSDGEAYQLLDLKALLKSSANYKLSTSSINLIAKFDNSCKVIQETDKAYLVQVPCYYRNQQDRSKIEERPKYVKCWVPKAQTELINESISEGFNSNDKVALEYEELTITLAGNQRAADDWDEVEHTGSYTYEVSKTEVADAIWENFLTDEDVADIPGGMEALEDNNEWYKFLETNFDKLFDEYYDELLEYFEARAIKEFERTYSWDDYKAGRYSESCTASEQESHLDILEEDAEYSKRLTVCPECGDGSYDHETGFCINCGFN